MPESLEEKELLSAIGALETRRGVLGDAVVDTSIAALRQKLQQLQAERGKHTASRQRKQATVLFADVSGFTSICSGNDAETVTDAINSLWEALDSIIISRGGTVDKHIGDCVMAVWGTRGVREDDAVRAVDAALAMQETAPAISGGSGGLIPPFRIRIGIHTGPVFLSDVGTTGEYTAMGDTVNMASRLQNLAPLGGVRITRETWKHVKNRFLFSPMEAVKVKGIDREVTTCLVEARKPGGCLGLDTSVLGVQTGMAGRREELETLLNHFRAVSRSGGYRMDTIIGEAGIGKSRLLHEFRTRVETEPGRVVFFNARCTPGMEDTPCGVFRDILRISAGVLENDSSRAAMEKLLGFMGGYVPREEAARACFYAGFNTSPAGFAHTDRDAIPGREALAGFFRAVAERETVLLYLEDLHWADSVSLDLVGEIASSKGKGSLFALCLARPPLLLSRPNWGKGVPGTTLRLSPLSPSELEGLVRSILRGVGSLPDSLVGMIVDNSDGNPFYAEELLKMLAEEGVIDLQKGVVNTGSPALRGVPTTLAGVLQARLDSLSEDERRVLQAASVVGRVFWDLTVGEICGTGAGEAITGFLSRAEHRELIRRLERSAFAGSGEYLFKHAILRDVTYETVLLRVRKKYHRLAARWLMENAGDRTVEFQGAIAVHFELGEDWPEAVKWLSEAGDSAVVTSGYTQAVSLYTRALSVPGEFLGNSRRARLLLKRGAALEKLSRYPEAMDDLEQVLELADEQGDPGLSAEALSTMAWIATVTGHRDSAREYAFRARDFAEESGEMDLLARVTMRMADYEEDQTYGKVLSYFSRALDIYTSTGNENGAATALLNMGNVALAFRLPREAGGFYRRSMEKYEALGSRWGIANCLGNLGCVASALGDTGEAVENYGKSMEMSLSIGDREGVAICSLNLGDACLEQGSPEKALLHHGLAVRTADSAGIRPLLLAALRGRAQAHLMLGDRARAAVILRSITNDPAMAPGEGERIEGLLQGLDTLPEPTAIDEIVKREAEE